MDSIAASRSEGESGSGDAGTVFSLPRFDRAGSIRISVRGGHRLTRQASPPHPSTTPFAGLGRRDDVTPFESDPDSGSEYGDDLDRRRIVVHFGGANELPGLAGPPCGRPLGVAASR